ncbi:MAG: metallophosphoesterase, partial [Nitrospirae bacterium]|nr:metallophosphoesterase [Nitrospirota bacterium]
PRDKDPRACYVFIADEKIEFVRVKYDIEKTQKKMHYAGLPLRLIERLERGV